MTWDALKAAKCVASLLELLSAEFIVSRLEQTIPSMECVIG